MNATPDVSTAHILGVFYARARRYPWMAFLILLGASLASVFEVIAPIFYKRFFDIIDATPALGEDTLHLLLYTLGIALVLRLGSWASWRLSLIPNVKFDAKIMADLMNDTFARIMHHSYEFFSNSFVGGLVRKVSRLERSYEVIWQQLVHSFIPVVISTGGILIVVFNRSVVIGGVFAIWLTVFLYANYLVFRWKMKYDVRKAEADSKVTGTLSDSLTNSLSVKLFSGFSHEEGLLREAVERVRSLRVVNWGINEVIRATQGFLTVAIEIAVMVWAFYLYRAGTLTLGDFFLFQAYIITLANHVWGLGWVMKSVYEAVADAKEAIEIVERPYDVQDTPGASPLRVSEGRIEFRDVAFSFHETRAILKHFSLTIAPSEKVAFVGASGAGKTTVIKLILRLYDVQEGAILIDGEDISKVTQDSLRDAIALVPQEPILFHRSLRDNIRYGKREATDEEVYEAAKKAHCHEFIATLPEGYDTLVGERGIKLSGGERQRIAIARAILKDAPILVLDEATSSLDSESEHLIQDALKTLMEGKTVIAIAHRLSTIITMDRIVVMEGGRVRASGTHQELLQKDDLYKRLWSIQAGGFLTDAD
ncbi:MAG TPA: ABC transporter ATP-binding protein [Candidatus Paceibacterota bacterium]|nr:ABC transporter ATP-binding protein [Candidatus Paceibacterota bacterium]